MLIAELLEKLVYRHGESDLGAGGGQLRLRFVYADEFGFRAAARQIYKMPAHGSGREREKMLPALPIPVLCRHQADVDLIDQLRRLQRVPLSFAPHYIVRKASQVRVDEIEQFVLHVLAALPPPGKQLCDLARLFQIAHRSCDGTRTFVLIPVPNCLNCFTERTPLRSQKRLAEFS